jgi:hypothetical protein
MALLSRVSTRRVCAPPTFPHMAARKNVTNIKKIRCDRNSIDGQIRAVLFDGVMTSYPFAVWGARFKYAPSDGFRGKIGACQLTEKMWDPQEHGADFAFRSSDGVSLMTQLDSGAASRILPAIEA